MTLTADPETLQGVVNEMTRIAKSAGTIISEAIAAHSNSKVHHKGAVDLVTDTDRQVETFIISELSKLYPGSLFLAEESVSQAEGTEVLTHEPTWIIDPIDGTTNFVHGFPFFCVSIGLAIGRSVVAGVIYNPNFQELFRAVRGQGAFLNDRAIKVSEASTIGTAVIATNVGYDRTPEGVEFMMSNFKTLLLNGAQSIRCGGSAAYEMCCVACGRLDAFYEKGIHAWDVAAGSIIVEEAGGVTRDMNGRPLDLLNRRVLCGNPTIVNLLAATLHPPPN